ncbi:glutathione binding-like protein [Pseudomonas sp. RW10S2]|uniref:glutathione binding-like protein n=1 Tax=Pseudomonas sp. RW10S2 TaxID=459637 RepID=UPI0016497404|nr:glutathione binding-like protein [Pseudomonas sp. RW10S2]MBC3468618.1 glutathione S-transferase N-terminal domain-containing protein [Pseudomonas sp. RW10S2]
MLTLFFAAGASSMASHILLNESELPFQLERVDLMKKTWAGGDYNAVNPKNYVPALRLDNGEILTEGAVILSYIADLTSKKTLLARSGLERYRQLEWLNYISMELHKNFITPERHGGMSSNFLSKTHQGQRDTFVRVAPRLAFVDAILRGRSFLCGDIFTAPDAYLYVMCTWGRRLGFEMDAWPGLRAFAERVADRPAVQKTVQVEGPAHSLHVQG